MARFTWLVPDDLMIPLGAEATAHLEKCADNWSDSEVASLRSRLPYEYHAVPTDELRRQWINIRKRGTDGYRLNGHGPTKGSRKHATPQWYLDYLASDYWQKRRLEWLDFWKKCCLCGTPADLTTLEVHHNAYIRLGHEEFTDCVVLCRTCHEIHTTALEIPDHRLMF